jgi:ELWxxDGT repeat protein
VALLALAPAASATLAPRLVADLAPGTARAPVSTTEAPATTSSFIVFVADDGVHGMEPWVSDGSVGGASLLVDVMPGPGSSSPASFLVLGDRVIFAANDGDHGREPWITDGTPAGTALLADLAPGAASSAPRSFTAFGAGMVFAANDRDHGEEPWISDGTPAGTRLIRDIVPGTSSSFAMSFLDLHAGIAVFAALADLGSIDVALYRTDGSTGGTWKVAGPRIGERNPYVDEIGLSGPAPVAMGGRAWFFVSPSHDSEELWSTDGIDAAARLDVSIPAPPWFPRVRSLVATDSRLFFPFDTPGLGTEPWSSDGTPAGTALTSDLEPGAGGSYPRDLVAWQGGVAFTARTSAAGQEPWFSDGSAAGTAPIADLAAGPDDSYCSQLTVASGALWFVARASSDPAELWRVLPGGGAVGVGDFRADNSYVWTSPMSAWNGGVTLSAPTDRGLQLLAASPNVSRLTNVISVPAGSAPEGFRDLGRVIFSTNEQAVMASDGTPAGTELLASGGTADAAMMGGRLYFAGALPPGSNREPFATDGTVAGSAPVADVCPGDDSSWAESFGATGSLVFFGASDATHGIEPWVTDGTEPGTRLLKDIYPTKGSWPHDFVALGDSVAFVAHDPCGYSWDMWMSDGSEAGTFQLTGIPGLCTWMGRAEEPIVAGSTLYFTRGGDDREPWSSDGTRAGTQLIVEIRADGTSGATALAAFGGRILFMANDGVHGFEPWVSDGTAAGTLMLADAWPGAASSLDPDGGRFVDVGGRAYFAANDGANGTELWVTDGTAAGTQRVADLRPGPIGSQPSELAAVHGALFCSADDGIAGRETWIADASGLRLLADLAPGAASSAPRSITPIGWSAWFSADDGVSGAEPWTVELDLDQDDVPDRIDNCRGGANPAQDDADSDGIGAPCDCDDARGDLHDVPVEVAGLRVAQDPAGIVLTWDAEDALVGPGVRYDIAMGPLGPGPLTSLAPVSCAADDVTPGASLDPAGSAWLLVRATAPGSPCGDGTYGRGSGERAPDPREALDIASPCP